MWEKIVAFIDALIIHAIFFIILIFSFNFSKAPLTALKQDYQLDEAEIQLEVQRLHAEAQAQQQALAEQRAEYQQHLSQQQQRLHQLQQQRQTQQQRLEQLERQLETVP